MDGNSSTVPRSLMANHQSLLRIIDRVRTRTEKLYREHRTGALPDYLDEHSSTVSILGERGSGKSTLLTSVCNAMRERGEDIVLPVMRPEHFAPQDSVMSCFLASLWAHLANEDNTASNVDVLRLVADTARSYAASRIPLGALEHGTDNPFDYAEDAVAASRSGVRLQGQLEELGRAVCEGPSGKVRLLIVPIDDPDLAPGTIGSIFSDLLMFSRLPGIVPIACAAPVDLALAWADARSGLPPERAAFRFEREMEKLFPVALRVEIMSLAPWQRPTFVPIGEELSILDRLSRLGERLNELGGGTWSAYPTFSSRHARAGLVNPLPSIPRTLVQLGEATDDLERLRDAPDAERHPADEGMDDTSTDTDAAALLATFNKTLEILGAPLRAALRLQPGQAFHQLATDAASAKPRIALQVEALNVSIASDREAQLRRAKPLVSLDLRPISKAFASLRADENGNPTVGPSASPKNLSAEVSSSFFAITELVAETNAFVLDHELPGIGIDEWSWLQEFALGGRPTDDKFLVLPYCATFTSIARLTQVWNRLAAEVSAGSSIHRIFTYALRGALTGDGEVLDRDGNTYDRALDEVLATYANQEFVGDRGRSFDEWVEEYLPYQWHEAFFSSSEIESFCARHTKAVTERCDGHDRAGVPFRRRLERLLDVVGDTVAAREQCWVAGYAGVASRFGVDTDRLATFEPLWRELVARTEAGAIVAAQTQHSSIGIGSLAPFESAEGAELLRRALQLLRERKDAAEAEASRTLGSP